MPKETLKVRDISKLNHTSSREIGSSFSIEIITLSAVLRIADSMEAMAKNHTDLIRSHDYLKQRNKDLLNENDHLKRSAAAYKGKMNREKNKKQDGNKPEPNEKLN